MKHLSNSSISKFLISAVVVLFLIGCSTVDRGTQPTAKSASPAAPTTEQPRKEEPSTPPPAGRAVVVPAEPSPPPPKPPAASPKAPPPAPVLRVTEVVWSSVNLREGPGLNYKVVGNAKKGTPLAILEEKGQWLRVRLEDGKEVWVSRLATSLAPKPPPSNPPPKPKPM